MEELRPIPFIGESHYRVARDGQVFTRKTSSRPGRPPRQYPITPMARMEAEDAAGAILGQKRLSNGSRVGLVRAPGEFPAGETGMVWCFLHAPGDEFAWGGRFIDAEGDTERGWYLLHLGDRTAIVHGTSIAAAAFGDA